MNIYVGNLPFSATEDELRQVFAAFGEVSSVSLIRDKFTGDSRGFGFVVMPSAAEAQAAIAGMNGKDFKVRALTVNEARPRPEGGGFGGGRSDRGGGRGDRNGGGRRPGGDRGGRRSDW